jgi:hypothetical protein
MKTTLESLRDWLAGTDDEETRKLVQEQLATPGSSTANFVEQMRKRLRQSRERGLAESFTPQRIVTQSGLRKWAALLAAASLLIIATVYVATQWFARPSTELVAIASLQYRADRSTNTTESVVVDNGVFQIDRASFDVVVRSPRDGYAAIVMLDNEAQHVFPQPQEDDVFVRANRAATYGPLLRPSESATVLIVVTPSAMTETIRRTLATDPSASKEQVVARVRGALKRARCDWFAFDQLSIASSSVLSSSLDDE